MEKDVPRTVSPETAGKWRKTYWTSANGPACHSRWLQCHWGGCFCFTKKRTTYWTHMEHMQKWIWKIIFPWSSKVAVQRVPKTQWWITFSLKSSKNHLMGIPIFSSAIFRWSSDTSTISLRNYIHQQKTWSIPTLTQSTPRFCCFRKKKKRRLRCHVTGYALCLEPRLQHNGSPLGIIGTRDFPERTRWVKVAPNMRLFSISKHH